MKKWKRVIRLFSIMLMIGAGSLAIANSLKMKPPADCAEGDSRAICFPGEGGGDVLGGSSPGAEQGIQDPGGGDQGNDHVNDNGGGDDAYNGE